jgi:hypothetical protein
MSINPLFFSQARTEPVVMIPAYAQRPRVIFKPGPLGSRIHGISLSSSSAAPSNVQFGIARPLTLGETTGIIVDGGAGADTITRVSGSFIADGWRPGERLLVQDATTLANDNMAILSAVAAVTLTLPAGFTTTQESMNAVTGLYRVALKHWVACPAGAGKPSVVAVSGLDTTNDPELDPSPDRAFTLGPNERLIAYLSATLGAGETLDINVSAFDW